MFYLLILMLKIHLKKVEKSLYNTLIFKGCKINISGVLKELVFNRKPKFLPRHMIQSHLTRLAFLKARILENNWNYYTKEEIDVLSLKPGGRVFITLTRIG